MKLKQTLEHEVNGYWDGGAKKTFEWSIESKSFWVNPTLAKIGSWEANHYFSVKAGKSDKQTLANAKKHLRAVTRIPSVFEYIN